MLKQQHRTVIFLRRYKGLQRLFFGLCLLFVCFLKIKITMWSQILGEKVITSTCLNYIHL